MIPEPSTSRSIRPLIIAEGANPELTSASLVGWGCARAVGRVTDAHIVTELRNRDAFLRAGMGAEQFTAVNSRKAQGAAWQLSKLLSGSQSFGWSLYAALSNLAYPFFERALWRQFEGDLRGGRFDLVHRILPLSPTTPSWLSGKLAALGIPFVLGPLNGGVPWPAGFESVRRQERDRAGMLRALYRLQPGIRRTRELSAAILAGSRTTLREMPEHLRSRCILIPENAVDTAQFPLVARPPRTPGPLRAAFVGRLVALKGVEMLLEAAASLIKAGQVELDIIGDGPEMPSLRAQSERLGLAGAVQLDGWVPHESLQARLCSADVLAFPSIREFGGGAVLEAMALGLPPVVLDHGGPPELVPPGCGWVLPLQSRDQIVRDLRELLSQLANDPAPLASFGKNAQAHVRQFLTWDAKAEQIRQVYEWVLGRRSDKPDWGTPLGFANPVAA